MCRHLEIADSTWHRWVAQYGGMKTNDAKRLKELEAENARLKRLLADAELDKSMLKESRRETSDPGPSPPRRRGAAATVRGFRAPRVVGEHRSTQRLAPQRRLNRRPCRSDTFHRTPRLPETRRHSPPRIHHPLGRAAKRVFQVSSVRSSWLLGTLECRKWSSQLIFPAAAAVRQARSPGISNS